MAVVLKLVLAACAGALLGAATFLPWLWFAAPFLFAVLLFLIFRSTGAESFSVGFSFGLGLMGASFSWGFSALPLVWLGISDPSLSLVIVFGIWLFYSAILALPIAFWGWGIRYCQSGYTLLIIAPLCWIVAEFFRALLHAIVSWGAGSTFGANFSFGFVGYALAWSDFLWVACIGGVVSLGIFLVCISTILYILWERRIAGIRGIIPVITAYLVFVLLGSVLPNAARVEYEPGVVEIQGIRIAPISTAFDPALMRTNSESAEKTAAIAELVLASLTYEPDIIVLPEYSRFLSREHLLPPETRQVLSTRLAVRSVLLIDSERAKGSLQGTVSFFDGGKGEIVAQQEKRFLIPLGEYLPYHLIAMAHLFGLKDESDMILSYRTYKPSDKPFTSRIFERSGVTLGVLACSETFAPFSYKAVSDAGADVLINIASHSWIRGRADILFGETLAMARVHAVFTGKPYIQASNHAPSYAIFPTR